nr:AarF/UbiB family protein [Vibrio galatheae]
MRALGLSQCSHISHSVFRAYHPLYGELVAKFALSTRAKFQLRSEAHFLQHHQSPYWPQFFDSNSHQHVDWLMMSLVEGKSLEQQEDRFNVRQIKQLETGLHAIHCTGFIHGDIKPANIVIKPDGSAVFVDFGSVLPISKHYFEQPYSSVTPRFASFNALVRNDRVRAYDDFASLAIVVHTLMYSHPFSGLSVAEFSQTNKKTKIAQIPAKYQLILTQELERANHFHSRLNTD